MPVEQFYTVVSVKSLLVQKKTRYERRVARDGRQVGWTVVQWGEEGVGGWVRKLWVLFSLTQKIKG